MIADKKKVMNSFDQNKTQSFFITQCSIYLQDKMRDLLAGLTGYILRSNAVGPVVMDSQIEMASIHLGMVQPPPPLDVEDGEDNISVGFWSSFACCMTLLAVKAFRSFLVFDKEIMTWREMFVLTMG